MAIQQEKQNEIRTKIADSLVGGHVENVVMAYLEGTDATKGLRKDDVKDLVKGTLRYAQEAIKEAS